MSGCGRDDCENGTLYWGDSFDGACGVIGWCPDCRARQFGVRDDCPDPDCDNDGRLNARGVDYGRCHLCP